MKKNSMKKMNKLIVTNQNWKVGDKVVRGKDFKTEWNNQDKGSVYGVIDSISDAYGENTWVYVRWIDYKGKNLLTRSYRIGPEKFDLYFYEQ